MSQTKSDTSEIKRVDVRENRRFSVSANRGQASQKVRYVEAGGAAVDTGECKFCQSFPDLSDNRAEDKPEASC